MFRQTFEPTKQQIEKRNLIHEPFEEWCELLVPLDPDKTGIRRQMILKFDFGFCGRSVESTEKLTFLGSATRDKDTGLIGSCPTCKKLRQAFSIPRE